MKNTDRIGSEARPLRVAIVGSGPAGFYAAFALLKQEKHEVKIDLFERLPTPYGLVRGGVAPDHQKTKAVAKAFQLSAEQTSVRFFGNVELARDITVDDLKLYYDQILYAIGNEEDRRMGIVGEGLGGVTPASVLVGWYNAHPDYQDITIDFGSKRVAIVGNGNVALDSARILAKTTDSLETTDIADHALEVLSRSGIEDITVIGRRGPVQAAFTAEEIREIGRLDNVSVEIAPEELELDAVSQAELDAAPEKGGPREVYRLLKELADRDDAGRPRTIRFKFLCSPREILGNEEKMTRAMVLEKNRLREEDSGRIVAEGTGEFEQLDIDWVFVAIGYQGKRLPDPPFDPSRGTIANIDGRVIDPDTKTTRPNEYVAGWAKSGPKGLIGTHRPASAKVVALMLEDLENGLVPGKKDLGDDAIVDFLEERGIQYVTFDDWLALDQEETERGRERGAPRRKFADLEEMLDVIERSREES